MAAQKPRAKKSAARNKKTGRLEKLEINDLRTLRVIIDPTRLAIVESLAQPGSVSDVAELLDVPRTRLYHHFKMLEEHGLIRVSSTRRKGALSEKLYEPTAHSFGPGTELLESEDRPEQAEAVIAAVLDTTREDLRRSLLQLGTKTSDEDNAMYRATYRLTPEEAKQLVEEFTELVERYAKLSVGAAEAEGTRRYALTWLFYPSSRRI